MNKWVIKMTRSAMEGINYLAVTLYENEKLVAAEIVSSPTEAYIFTTKKDANNTIKQLLNSDTEWNNWHAEVCNYSKEVEIEKALINGTPYFD